MFSVKFEDLAVLASLCMLVSIYFSIRNSNVKVIILVAFFILSVLIVGMRPLDAGFDTHVYVEGFNIVSQSENIFHVSSDIKTKLGIGSDPSFWGITFLLSSLGVNEAGFIFSIALISVIVLYGGLEKLFNKNAIILLLAFIACGTFYNTYGNAIRQAFVLSLLPYVIYYRFVDFSKFKLFFLSILCFSFHKSSGLIIFIYIMMSFLSIRGILILYFSSFVISIMGGRFVASYISQDIYSSTASVYSNAAFLILHVSLLSLFFIRMLLRNNKKDIDFRFEFLLKTFTVFCALSTIFAFNEFAYNRVANFAYEIQVFILVYSLIRFVKQKNITGLFAIFSAFVWGVIILNTSSVSQILYG